MKTLVIGTGGREHALALALSRDPQVDEVHAAPGNPGIAAFAPVHDVDPADGAAVADLAVLCMTDMAMPMGVAKQLAGGFPMVSLTGRLLTIFFSLGCLL